MKRTLIVLGIVMLLIVAFTVPAVAEKPDKPDCTTIQDGTLTDSAGNPITMGFDEFGYNYQAHLFVGTYDSSDRNIDGTYWGDTGDYVDDQLQMKWSNEWLANVSCDDDDKLDRHYGFDSYIGSGAWLTNHQSGDNDDGSHWTYFIKIVAAPADAYPDDGIWYAADGTEIGPVIWGQFAIIQEVASGVGATYVSPFSPGFGQF